MLSPDFEWVETAVDELRTDKADPQVFGSHTSVSQGHKKQHSGSHKCAACLFAFKGDNVPRCDRQCLHFGETWYDDLASTNVCHGLVCSANKTVTVLNLNTICVISVNWKNVSGIIVQNGKCTSCFGRCLRNCSEVGLIWLILRWLSWDKCHACVLTRGRDKHLSGARTESQTFLPWYLDTADCYQGWRDAQHGGLHQ